MKILETERLIVRQVGTNDASFLLELLNTPTWLEFIGDRGVNCLSTASKYVEENIKSSYIQNGFGMYLVQLKDSFEPIGLCGFVKRDYLRHPDIGFALLPKFEGKGYAFEASKAVLNHGRTQLGMQEILAITTAMNLKSQKLLEKLGLQQKGTVRPDQKEDLLLFSISFTH
nr:GNAT family N-acetyltransferase [Allomuricauda sp.]